MPDATDQPDPAAKRRQAAERNRRLRERRRRGARVWPIEGDADLADELIAHGLLNEEDVDNPAELPFALMLALTAVLRHLRETRNDDTDADGKHDRDQRGDHNDRRIGTTDPGRNAGVD